MSQFYTIFSLIVIILAVGCTVTPNEADMTANSQIEKGQSDSCGASVLKHIVGHPYTAIPDLPKHRWIRAGYKYTQQYKPSRLNIVTNENGIITTVRCG